MTSNAHLPAETESIRALLLTTRMAMSHSLSDAVTRTRAILSDPTLSPRQREFYAGELIRLSDESNEQAMVCRSYIKVVK